jgi:gas vesicle protein
MSSESGRTSTDTAYSKASAMAGEATQQVKQAAAEATDTVTGEVKGLLNRQLEAGVETLGGLARSVKRAAQDLEQDSPQTANLVRTVASRVDGFADGLRSQSIEDLWNSAASFTRRQPALVFGLAALAGFFVLRTVKSSPTVDSPSIQPTDLAHSSQSSRPGSSSQASRRTGSYGS